jgi:hypothetical protein
MCTYVCTAVTYEDFANTWSSGANPTIAGASYNASYNTSVVNFYNTTSSLARCENRIIFILTLKPMYYNAGIVFKSRIVAPEFPTTSR